MFLSERTSVGRTRRIAVRVVAPLVLVALAPSVVGATPSQSVDSLKDRAAKIAAELDRLEDRESLLDEEANSARLELAELQANLEANEASYAAAEAELGSTREVAVAFAREAFTGSTVDDDPLRYLAQTNSMDESARRAFIEVKTGASSDVAESLEASQKVLSGQRAELDAARAEVEAKSAEIDAAQNELDQLIADKEQLSAQVQGELADAVAKEQERLRKAAEEKARAEAAAEAARAATAAARRGAATVSAQSRPATTGSSSTSTGSSPTTAEPTVKPSAPPAPSVPSGGTAAGQAAVAKAMTQLGVPYKWAGSSPSTGFDCSGLVLWAYAGNKSLPHSSRSLRSMTTRISEAELVPGDLVFGGSPVHHVGIYIGNGQMVHAPRTGDVVKVSGIYASSKPVSFGRLP